MTKAATPNRWYSAWRAAERPTPHDPADLGTAFGLDLSMSPLPHEPPAAPAPVARQRSWMQRLARRAKPSA